MSSSGEILNLIVGVGGFALLLGLFYGLFWAGYKLAAKLTPSAGLRVLLMLVFGTVFNVALLTAIVGGCIAILGSPNFH